MNPHGTDAPLPAHPPPAPVFSPTVELAMPGRGRVATAIVRNPGSGVLHEPLQPI